MKVLPFPSIRPTNDRVIEVVSHASEILGSKAALMQAIEDGSLIKDPGAAYYVYRRATQDSTVIFVLGICPIDDYLIGSIEHAAAPAQEASDTARRIAELHVQSEPVQLVHADQPVLDIIVGAACQGTPLYNLIDPNGAAHTVWEIRRKDAVDALRTMFEQVPSAHVADECRAAATVMAGIALRDAARAEGTFSAARPYKYMLCALTAEQNVVQPEQGVSALPQLPPCLVMHQVGLL